MRAEAAAEPFQLAAHLSVIVDLAIEDDDGAAIFGSEGLGAGFEADDLQARGGQRDRAGLEDALLVRPAVQEGGGGGADPLGIGM
jgi:hypothetical protein